MSKLVFKENDLKTKVKAKLNEACSKGNLQDALTIASQLNIPSELSNRKYLLDLYTKLKTIKNSGEAVSNWIDTSIKVINNAQANAIIKTKAVKVPQIKPRCSIVNKLY